MDRQEKVATRAANRCEYCKIHQSLQGATFHIEHVVPRARGGPDDLHNLALACPSCNLHKSDRTQVWVAATNRTVNLFNPRVDNWNAHFEWDEYNIVGKTEVGSATIDTLDLNNERRLKIRQDEQLFGLFPPDDE